MSRATEEGAAASGLAESQPVASDIELEGVTCTGSLVHDMKFAFHGDRLAAACIDHSVKVYEDTGHGAWELRSEWKAHKAPVLRVGWAHPEFGASILVSVSADNECIVWEEQEKFEENSGKVRSAWQKRAALTDALQALNDVAFAPRWQGLQIATASSDGNVRIYAASDATQLAQWRLLHTLHVDPTGVRALSWCKSKFAGPMLAIASVEDGLTIWAAQPSGTWARVASAADNIGTALDVSWGASVGRSYQRLATANKDGTVRIWHLHGCRGGAAVPELECVAILPPHGEGAWRVQWNATSSVLASSGEDGVLRLWKADATRKWACVAQVALAR